MDNVLKEAKRLYDLGFAILWIHPGQKRPIESGWTTGDRYPWHFLKDTYKKGMNVGVRTGTASKLGKNYLAVIDVDIKRPECRQAALTALANLIGDNKLPEVRSGSGGGSRHLYCVTAKPFKMVTVAKEDDWEICVYSDGRQMVLPPSKTKGFYEWKKPIAKLRDIPLMPEFEEPEELKSHSTKSKTKALEDFDVEEADLYFGFDISDKILKMIKTGEGVEDRSASMLPIASALHNAGLNKNQILTVLTDTTTYIGECSYEHAKTRSRKRAAQWAWKYTVAKIFEERSAEAAFRDAPLTPSFLSESEAIAQLEEMKGETKDEWRLKLVRGGKDGEGPPKSLIQNVTLILQNVVSEKIFERNTFALRDTYGCDAPWGGKKGEVLKDDDTPMIKLWLGRNFGFEPKDKDINDAMVIIACDNAYDPVRDWLEALPKWDGRRRLNGWLAQNFEAKGDPSYLAQVFRKWLVAMVMRVYRPGAKFDWMPIFEGAQGVGKSSFGRLLVGEKVFLDWLPNLNDKDSALSLQGMWGVEMGELSQFRKNELENIKAFITRTVDKFRPPYGQKLIESPRRCVFFGTTNRDKYLTDDTGNRRFKPLVVGNLDFEQLEKDREQLFAEALWLYKERKEVTLELTGKAKIFESKMHDEKMVEDDADVMKEAMQDFMRKVGNEEVVFDLEKFRILDLFEGAGPLQKWKADNRSTQFAAKMLRKLGGEKRTIKGFRYWKVTGGAGVLAPLDTLHKEEGFTNEKW